MSMWSPTHRFGIQFFLFKNLKEFCFKVCPTPVSSASQQPRINCLYLEIELTVERLSLSSRPRSPSKLQHLHLQEIMQNSPRVPSPFWISDQTVHPTATSSASPFSFFYLQSLRSLPIKTAWMLRPVSRHTLPLYIRRWREETSFHPPPLLKSWPLLRVFPTMKLTLKTWFRAWSLIEILEGKNRAKIKIWGFHTFLWPHEKYWLEIQRVVKLIVEQSPMSTGRHSGIPTMHHSFCPLTKVCRLQLKPVRVCTLRLSTNVREQGSLQSWSHCLGGPISTPSGYSRPELSNGRVYDDGNVPYQRYPLQ